jgi:hypothetical protein
MVSLHKKHWRPLHLIVLLYLLCLMGCGTGPLVGLVYTKVKMPLSRDLNVSPLKDKNGTGRVIKIKEPISGYGVYAEINSNAIGEIAKKHGIGKVYFADQEQFSILGIWTTTNVIIYGSSPD